MVVMGLGVKCGDIVQIEIKGADEEAACEELRTFVLKESLMQTYQNHSIGLRMNCADRKKEI